ncbi:MAG: membrane dipeptidase [Planctomycetota bacterium]
MRIFDAHLDLALNGVDWNRDLREPVDTIRNREVDAGMQQAGRGNGTVSFHELQLAEVHTCLATLLARQEPAIDHDFGWTSEHACYAMAHAHLAYYRALEKDGLLKVIRSSNDLAEHNSATSHNGTDGAPHNVIGCILTMEGADPLLTPDTVDEFFHLGLRAIGLTHYGNNRYGGGTESNLGLATEARPLLRRIDDLGMILDLTHLSDKAFWQVLDQFDGPVHASHQNSKRLADWQRQYSDEQYLEVIGRGGVVGVACDIIMLQHNYVRNESTRMATLETIAENIDIVCQLAGNADHVGIGSDLDGAYGCEQTPVDLDRISDLQRLPEILGQRGYSPEDIAQILYGNWDRFFQQHLPTSG